MSLGIGRIRWSLVEFGGAGGWELTVEKLVRDVGDSGDYCVWSVVHRARFTKDDFVGVWARKLEEGDDAYGLRYRHFDFLLDADFASRRIALDGRRSLLKIEGRGKVVES